jgi:hypothetical protein
MELTCEANEALIESPTATAVDVQMEKSFTEGRAANTVSADSDGKHCGSRITSVREFMRYDF